MKKRFLILSFCIVMATMNLYAEETNTSSNSLATNNEISQKNYAYFRPMLQIIKELGKPMDQKIREEAKAEAKALRARITSPVSAESNEKASSSENFIHRVAALLPARSSGKGASFMEAFRMASSAAAVGDTGEGGPIEIEHENPTGKTSVGLVNVSVVASNGCLTPFTPY